MYQYILILGETSLTLNSLLSYHQILLFKTRSRAWQKFSLSIQTSYSILIIKQPNITVVLMCKYVNNYNN